MVRLFAQSTDPTSPESDDLWAVLPSAVWDLDFSGVLEWIEAQGCQDAAEFKRLVRKEASALSACLGRTKIRRASAGAVALVGAASEEEAIRRMPEILTEESKADFLRVLLAAFRDEQDVHIETAIVSCALEARDVRVHWRFVRSAEGKFTRAIVHAVDMTDERELQQRLLLSERMSAIGTLTASIIHEIKNPLTFVWNHLRTLREEFPAGSGSAAELVKEAYEGADRIRAVANEITELSHGGELAEPETVDLKRALDGAIRMAQSEAQHRATIVREYEDTTLYTRGSRTRVGQVFLNLVVNAAQAIEPGDLQRNTITVRARAIDGDRVCIEVQDTGPGIPAQLLRRVFDPFVTTKPAGRGTGLGLAICRRIVHSLGGTIDIKSHPGQGTVVRVVLKRASQAPIPLSAPPPSISATRRAACQRLHVLVVDDEPVIARLIQKALVEHEVTIANDGREAVALMGERAFDVILCDLIMPEMTGMDVYRA
ncbi:MAG: ATP-binding protein, partial [Polyangiales bacterium]